MNSDKTKNLLNVLLVLVFLSSLITGTIKFPGFLHLFGINYAFLPIYQINFIHNWSGIILIVLIIIHLIFHWRWIASIFNFKITSLKVWQVIFILIIVGLVVFALTQEPRRLASSEVRDYQGQKLDSINSLENTSIAGTQYIDPASYRLEVSGLVEDPKSYTYDQVLSFNKYSKVVDINCVTGWNAKILWEGVLLKDILNDAGIKPEAKVVIFYAKDGFTTSLPLDFIINNNILLADKINNVVLPPEKGFPFQLVAEQKWGYKWIKWITKIELSDDVNYKGTYEKSGYNNDADVTGPKTENK